MTVQPRELTQEHREISDLIPWYVNASIDEPTRQRVEAHLGACGRCRDDLAAERRIFSAIAGDTGLEYMPAASLKRLQARLDGLTDQAAPRPAGKTIRETRWRVAALIAVMAAAIGPLLAERWERQASAGPAPAPFHTVTSPAPRPRGEVIRAVFSPDITLVELQTLLDEAALRIVSGPTDAGVYSLAAASNRPVRSSLALLRQHPAVRFAEQTQPETGGDP